MAVIGTAALDNEHKADFLAGTGEMGARIRDFDWTATPLGPIEAWPNSLKTSVSLILSSRHPMWIGWGRQMTFLYNDAYLHVLGPAKHPRALGRPASEVWAEIWNVCGPLADNVFENGEATFMDDVRLFMDRGNFLEETFYSFSYSPIRDDVGNVCGLFCPSTDVTPKVLNGRRLSTLSELAAHAPIEKTASAACHFAARIIGHNPDDIPFALLYLADAGGTRASLEQRVGAFRPGFSIPASIDLENDPAASPWPIAEVFRTSHRHTVAIEDLVGLPLGVADQAVEQAVVLPMASRGEHRPYGVLVAGVNPCRPLDADHLTFFELIASQVATAIQNARAVEEEKKRADLLAEIDRAKTVFFSNVSHEFRTPLTLMLGPLENLLAQSKDLRPEEHEQLEIAHRNSLRLLKLVNSLLDFSRLEAGRLKASYAETDLAVLTKELTSNFRSAMQAAGLVLEVDCPPLPQPVYVDREMWERIVLNLLSNAFKFTFEGQVTVRLRAIGGKAVLTVADTGIGIPENELPRIFERFHRVEGAKGRTYEGTGIGLALIHEYVKLHGGSIDAASRSGQGSTFTVTLPFGRMHLAPESIHDSGHASPSAVQAESFLGEIATMGAAAARFPRKGGATPRTGSGSRPRVLLADDNADMREHVTRILGDDFEVTVARDGQEALDQIRENPPDLLLSDIMMPAFDGLDLLRAVRADEKTHTLPVIFLSARAGEDMRVEGLEAGADDYLVKPFTASELRARVGTHLQMAKARRKAMEREAALRAEAEAARDQVVSVLESITDGFMAIDREWRVTYVNHETERLVGMRRQDMLGRNHWDLFPEAVGTAIEREYLRTMTGRVPVEFENFYEPWKRWFHVKACPAADGGLAVFYEDITNRRNAEQAVRESEERFRAIVETTPECVKIVARDGTLLHMNSSGLAMVGAACAEAVIGKSVYDLIAPEFRDAFVRFNESICGGEKGSFEFDIIALDGRRRNMETHAAPLRRPDGAVAQLAITHDISERKRREQAVLLLGAIVDSSDDAIISKNLNGIITSWNKSAERLFGYTASEAIGQPVTMLIPPDRKNEEPGILSRLRRGERVEHFETVRRCKDGSLLDIALTISPVKNAGGTVVGASKIARDITETKRAKHALLASEARFRQLADAMPQIVWTAATDGTVDYNNERYYEFTGFDRGTVGNHGWEPVVHPEDVPRCAEAWQSSVRNGQPFNLEYRLWDRRENRYRWFIGRALPVRGEDGRILKWFGTATDIDEQKRVEGELRRANQDLEQFAYSASHDLQEPLRTIKIYGELLTARYGPRLDGQAFEFLEFLRAGATRMEVLVGDLLAYTQVTLLDLPAEATDANEALAATLAGLTGAIQESGAQVTSDPLPSVRIPRIHLQQLFQNLIGNAIKYRNPNRAPLVHVSGKQDKGSWIFSVRDNGIGIEAEYKEHIFGLFKRLHTGDEYSGTGIGLAICQRIVERYHGRIWVESEPGRGSTFVFTLPV